MRTAAAIGGELGTAATVLGRLHRSAARGVARRDGCFDGSVKGESVSEWQRVASLGAVCDALSTEGRDLAWTRRGPSTGLVYKCLAFVPRALFESPR